MSIRAGIIGLPNVGKSTLFTALTAQAVERANYPFTTIDRNVGVVPVPDERLETLGSLLARQTVPAVVEIVDIAGLVEGASRGEGLGNRFLSHVREMDALIHVVRAFEDPNVVHVAATVDPERDIAVIETELLLADLAMVEGHMGRLRRAVKAGDPDVARRLEAAEQIAALIDQGQALRTAALDEAQDKVVGELQLLTAKPVLFVANASEIPDREFEAAIDERASSSGAGWLSIQGELEAEIAELEPADREAFVEALEIEESGLRRLARAVYTLLRLITFFTTPTEVRAWTVTEGASAWEAAGRIHTDFQTGFIKAEVFTVSELVEAGTEAALRDIGKVRLEGRDYLVQDGEVILFHTNR